MEYFFRRTEISRLKVKQKPFKTFFVPWRPWKPSKNVYACFETFEFGAKNHVKIFFNVLRSLGSQVKMCILGSQH